MANEKLISTIRYKGLSVGSSEIIIEDTSFYPDYTFTLTDDFNNQVVNLNQLQQLNTYSFNFVQVDRMPNLTKLYVKIVSLDGKFLSQADVQDGLAKEETFSTVIDATGKGSISLNTDFFPSFIGYGAEISFYHDPEYLYLVRTFNVSVLPVVIGGLEIVPARNVGPNGDIPYYPPFVEMGEEFYVRASYNGPSITGGDRPGRFLGKVNNLPFSANAWMPVGANTVLTLRKENDILTNPVTGKIKFSTLAGPANKNQQSISVGMGEARVVNNLRYPSYIDGFGWVNTGIKTVKLYRRLGPSHTDNRCVGIVQGLSIGTDATARLGPSVITKAGDFDEAYVEGLVPVYGANNPTLYRQSYLGKMGAISWDPGLLTTRESRVQFGKYQKSFTKVVENHLTATMTVTWNDISDSFADADYGVPASLIGSDVVVLIQPHDRADVCNTLFNTGGPKEFYITPVAYNSVGANLPYNGLVSVLVLRKSAMLDTYPSWVPYPRVIKADWAMGSLLEGEGAWVITIPEGTSIDLTEDRYVVQHTCEQTPQNAGHITYSWTNNRIKKEKSKITIFGSYTNFYPDPKHYAIWDLGPETSFSDVTDGRLRGEMKPYNASPWVTNDLSGPVNANAAGVVVLPTLGESTQFYQSSIISRNINGEPKKFSVFTRDSSKALYQGKLGLLVWNIGEMTNPDRRNQFGRYQASLTIPYNSANGVSTITLDQVNNSAASASWGTLASLKDPSLMMFINTEEYSEWNSTFWGTDKIQIGINYGQGPAFVGNVSVLLMRKVGWVNYDNKAKYPRVIYADTVDIGNASSYTLPINKTFMPDPLDDRYQVMAQVRPTTQVDSWIKFHWSKLTRTANDWKIELEGGGTSNSLQIAIVDYGPGSVLFGKGVAPSYVTEYSFTQPVPENGLVEDTNYALAPLIGPSYSIGGSTNWMAVGLTQRYAIRQPANNSLTVGAQGQTNDGTWGYGRNSARGYIGWDITKTIGSILKKQIPNLVARKTEVLGSTGFTLTSLAADISATGKTVTSLKKPGLVFVVVPEFGDVYFCFKPSADGTRINFTSSYNGQPYPALTSDQRVNTLVLEELKVMPNFAADTPYPRVIFASKTTASYLNAAYTLQSVKLDDPSYANVNIKDSRYQILFGYEIGEITAGGKCTLIDDAASSAREWQASMNSGNGGFGPNVLLNMAVIDYGPSTT